MVSTTLENLRVLTSQLPTFPSTVTVAQGFKEHKMTCGTSFSWDLLDRPELSCAHWFNSNGCYFPEHVHDGREWIIVFQGSILLMLNDTEKRLTVGQWEVIEPGTRHSARFLEDCHYLAIVIPKTKDWPTLQTK